MIWPKVHEFREECNEIARQCRQLSVQLLEQCVNIEEVQVLLKENAGSSKYFRNTEEMKYPRLKLAIEHNNKEFVGHVFCQQILRQQWHGDLLWQGTPLKFKIVHFLLQVLLAPLFVFSFFVAEIGKDFIEDNTSEFTNDTQKITWKHKIVKECQALKRNLDVPMNRFLIFSGYYFFFALTVLNLMSDSATSDFRIYACAIYTISMIWHDIQAISTLKSIKTFFKFWRVFDLIMHIFFIMAILVKLIFQNDDFRDQSFTSLMADLHQDIVYSFNKCLNGTFP